MIWTSETLSSTFRWESKWTPYTGPSAAEDRVRVIITSCIMCYVRVVSLDSHSVSQTTCVTVYEDKVMHAGFDNNKVLEVVIPVWILVISYYHHDIVTSQCYGYMFTVIVISIFLCSYMYLYSFPVLYSYFFVRQQQQKLTTATVAAVTSMRMIPTATPI